MLIRDGVVTVPVGKSKVAEYVTTCDSIVELDFIKMAEEWGI